MRPWLQALPAAVAGGAAVWGAFWLVESVLPPAVSVSLGAGRLVILLVPFSAAAVVVVRGRLVEAATLLAGSGAAWAVHEIQPFMLCQSDLLYRPCTVSEFGWMVAPSGLLIVCGVVAAMVARRRLSEPSRERART
jgi:hypothetical protein